MKKIFKLTGILALICTVCTAILAVVNAVTQKPIAQAREQKILNAVQNVLPPGAKPVKVERVIQREHGEAKTNTLFVSSAADGTVTAVAVQGTSTKGYGGPITLMVGIAADATLINYDVLEQTETPGLGTKLKDEPFRSNLLKRPDGTPRPVAGTIWKVTRDRGEIDAITAATISSRAALEAVRDAIATYDAVKDTL